MMEAQKGDMYSSDDDDTLAARRQYMPEANVRRSARVRTQPLRYGIDQPETAAPPKRARKSEKKGTAATAAVNDEPIDLPLQEEPEAGPSYALSPPEFEPTFSSEEDSDIETDEQMEAADEEIIKRPLFENDAYKIFVQKTGFKRQVKFSLDDHHYVLKIESKEGSQTLPVLKDIVEMLEKSLLSLLSELQNYYDKNSKHTVYITFHQPGMISAVRSQGLDLFSQPTAIVHHVMSAFYLFANSKDNLRLNRGFTVYVKVLCHENVTQGSVRRKMPLKVRLGCTDRCPTTHIPGCAYVEPKFERLFNFACLLTSFIIAFNHIKSLFHEDNLYSKLSPLWDSCHHVEAAWTNAQNLMLSEISNLRSKFALKSHGPYDISVLGRIAAAFNVQINVIKNTQEHMPGFERFPEMFDSSRKQIFLLQVSTNHIVPVVDICKLFRSNQKYICLICTKSFRQRYKHSCSEKEFQCQLCFCPFSDANTLAQSNLFFDYCDSKIKAAVNYSCDKCNATFLSQVCFDNHKKLVCKNKRTMCTKCRQTFRGRHFCNPGNQTFCSNCDVFFTDEQTHFCKMAKQKASTFWPQLIFFDFTFFNPNVNPKIISCCIWVETSVGVFDQFYFTDYSSELVDTTEFCYDLFQKKPKAKKVYKKNVSHETKSLIQKLRQQLKQKTCKQKFLEFILDHPDSVFLSSNEANQNMSIVLELLTKANLIPHLVKNNNSFILMKLKSHNITFLNVSNFFSGTKSDLASMINYTKSLIFFPLFSQSLDSCRNNFPNADQFLHWLDSEEMVQKKLQFYSFLNPHDWSFDLALKHYTIQQTEIVALSCLNFLAETFCFQNKLLKHLKRETDLLLFPFSLTTPTLASYSYALLQYMYLNCEDLISSPNDNICRPDHVSRSEHEFVTFMSFRHPEKQFIHAFSRPSGQKKFGSKYRVDLYSPKDKVVYQFEGCYLKCHLPPDCKDPQRQHLTEENLTENLLVNYHKHLFEKQKFAAFINEKFPSEVLKIEYMYECQWKLFKAQSEHYKQFSLENQDILKRNLFRLHLRTCQRSGLTETYRLSWSKAKNPNSTFIIADIVSCYSFVSANYTFPVGQPTILIGQELKKVTITNDQFFYDGNLLECGFIHCEILANAALEFPFLQYRLKSQEVVLGNCRSCCEKQNLKCQHRSQKSKSFTSCWTLAEICFSLKLKYQIVAIFEIIFFPSSKPVLKDFVNALNSWRLQNSCEGSPPEFCTLVNNNIGLSGDFALNPGTVCDNPMKKTLAKYTLNTIFGKLSSKTCNETNEIVRSKQQLNDLMKKFTVTELSAIDQHHLLVTYENENLKTSTKFNIFIGSLISAYARIYLYENMMKLFSQNIKIYAIDTDSIFFELESNCLNPLKFDITPGSFKPVINPKYEIVNFYSLGNRNYSVIYKDEKGQLKSLIKCKGLSFKSAELSNKVSPVLYEEFLQAYFRDELKSIKLEQLRKITTKKNYLTKIERKTVFTFTNNLALKRIVNDDGSTLPFGFKQQS
jgi:hypothetical protein